MKNFKKTILTMAMTMALGTSAFAASGFEFLLQLSGGVGTTIPSSGAKAIEIKGGLSADLGIDAQIGYMFQVKDGFGISLLGELGYSLDGYRMNYANSQSYYQLSYQSFKLGLLPKFNIGVSKGAIAIGIGGGAKIPITAQTTLHFGGESIVTSLTGKDITDLYSPSVIGYVKATFDYYLLFNDKIGMNFGFYLGGDFAPKTKGTKIGCNAFDFGLQIGFRFGPKA